MVETSHATRYLILLLIFFFVYSFLSAGILTTYGQATGDPATYPPIDISNPVTLFPYIAGLATGFTTYGVPYPLNILLTGIWFSIIAGIVFMIAIKSWWIALILVILTGIVVLISFLQTILGGLL